MYPRPLQELIAAFNRLPGIGQRTAERLALHIIKAHPAEAAHLAGALSTARQSVTTCSVCFNLTEQDPCPICADPQRQLDLLCVVETPADLSCLEAAKIYQGRYHVLSGALNPLEGVGPRQLLLKQLLDRIPKENIREVVIATNPTVEGEATADLLARALAETSVLVTRLGYGMPVGADLKYMDQATLAWALNGRRPKGA